LTVTCKSTTTTTTTISTTKIIKTTQNVFISNGKWLSEGVTVLLYTLINYVLFSVAQKANSDPHIVVVPRSHTARHTNSAGIL
jgi:hypothetical protein